MSLKDLNSLSNSYSIEPCEDEVGFYILHNSVSDTIHKINSLTKDFILISEQNSDPLVIIEALSTKYPNTQLSVDELTAIKLNLEKQGILNSPDYPRSKKKSYIKLRVTLIPGRVMDYLSKPFSFLFSTSTTLLFSILFALIAFLYIYLVNKSDLYDFITAKNFIILIPITYLSKFLHELGHASAVKKFGNSPGPIGFGFYLFTPVFFADVSSSWSLSARKRIVINLGGMYFQLLFSIILILFYFITSNNWYLFVSFFNSISILPNLNPFIKFDGYWVLSDLIGDSNLSKNSRKKFIEFKEYFLNRSNSPLKSKKDYLLLSYFAFNRIMIVLFIAYFLTNHLKATIHFPADLIYTMKAHAIDKSSSFGLVVKDFISNNLFPFLFYLFIISFLISKLFQIFKKPN